MQGEKTMKNATTCLYDGDFCQAKEERFNEWKNFAFNNASGFTTRPGMFDNCPKGPSITCDRYRRYLYIVEHIKAELQKQNEQNR